MNCSEIEIADCSGLSVNLRLACALWVQIYKMFATRLYFTIAYKVQ